MPEQINIYGGILHPADKIYRVSILSITTESEYTIETDLVLGEMRAVATNDKGYELIDFWMLDHNSPIIQRNRLTNEQLEQINEEEIDPKLKVKFCALIEQYQDIFD